MGTKSIKKNFIMNALLTISNFLFPFITYPYVSRVLMPEGIGKVSMAVSVVAYFNMIAQLGIPTYGIRACAKVRDDRDALSKVTRELFIINLIMAFISYVLLAVCVIFIPKLAAEKPLYIIVSLSIILNAFGMEWLFKGLEEYSYITIRSVIFKVIAVVMMFLAVQSQEDYVMYGFVSTFAASASFVLNLVYAGKYVDLFPNKNEEIITNKNEDIITNKNENIVGDLDVKEGRSHIDRSNKVDIKRHIKPVLVFFAFACATTVYTNLDTVMLGFMKSDVDVGYYNAAIKIKTILLGFVTSLGAVILPRASYYVEKKLLDEFWSVAKRAYRFVILFASPLAVYFMVFSKASILFISGTAFEGSIVPMQVIMPTILFIGITNILGIQIMVPLGREKQVLYSVIIGAVVDLILNLLLIPNMAACGAAIGTLVAEIAVLIYQLIVIWRDFEPAIKAVNYAKVITALLVGVLLSVWALEIPGLLEKSAFAGWFNDDSIMGFATASSMVELIASAIMFLVGYMGVLVLSREVKRGEILSLWGRG